MNIQLSISLLASDRIDTLKKCLDSIIPLLRELNSELIIVSTGHDPAVLELAGKYTPHIIPFTWCDDFSKARNAGLKRASGEWFLFLDDDEWFEDAEEIIRFFKSGEYKAFHSATYIQRNYSDWSGRTYTDVRVGRMCRLKPETKFIYAIHENLSPFDLPQKCLTAYVHHYGYVEKSQLRSDRNLPLLLKRFEDDPTPQACMQISLEYYNKEDCQNALEYCRLSLSLLENKNRTNTYALWLQIHLPVLLSATGQKEAALTEGEQLLKTSSVPEVGEAHLYAILAELCHDVKEYEKGLRNTLEFHKKIKYLEKHPEKAERQTGGTITFETAKERTLKVLTAGLHCAAALDETAQMQEFLTWFPWEKEGELRTHYSSLENWKQEYPLLKKAILKGYHLLDTDNPYVTLQKALYAEENQEPKAIENYFEICSENCPDGFICQLIELAERNNISLSSFADRLSMETWDKCAQEMAEQTEISDMPERLRRLCLLMPDHPLFTRKAEQYFLEKQLTRGIVEGPKLLELLGKYCECIRNEASVLYHPAILSRPDFYALPSRYKFAFIMEKLLGHLETGNIMDCIALLKKALHIYPQMSTAIIRLSDYMEEALKEPVQPASEEFAALGGQVKQMLMGLVENGQWPEAYGVTEQLTALLPEDLEILRLKQLILTHL
ncbi:MAG: glycosyltransferase [Lachnospiraceae bacterium]